MTQAAVLHASTIEEEVRRGKRAAFRDGRLLIALAMLATLLLLCTVGAWLAGNPNAQDAQARLLGPSLEHPFGVDELRRDLFARTVHGLRASLLTSFLSVPIGAAIGAVIGLVAGYLGRWPDAVLMRILDAWMAFPGILAAFVILAALGPGMVNVGVALALFSIPVFSRVMRAQVLVERRKDYVLAAKATGAGPVRLLVREVVPNTLPPLVTQLAITLTASILIASALSFLGLGERPPAPSLGGLLNASRPHLRDAWWYVTFPAGVLAWLLLSLNLLSDAIADRLSRA